MGSHGTTMLPGFAPEPDGGELVDAAQKTIGALRDQHAIQDWHELDCQIVITAARGVTRSRGIAQAQMLSALLQARAKLPEPVIAETDEQVRFEAERVDEWLRAHAAGDSADVPDASESAPIL